MTATESAPVYVLTLTEIRDGQVAPLGLELLALARKLAGPGASVGTVAFGPQAAALAPELIARGADQVHAFDIGRAEVFDGQLWCACIDSLARELGAGLVLFGVTPVGSELAPRLAFRLGGAVATGCSVITRDDQGLIFTRACFGGNARQQLRLNARPAVASVCRGALAALPADASRRGTVYPRAAVGERHSRLLESRRDGTDTLRLEDARVVVAGGRGVGGPDGFAALQALAQTMGGAVGATRVACDLGWCPRGWQVGLTGKTVAPQLYVAVGISGASHHIAGCAGAQVMVAINPDPQAPIFGYARYGITQDGLKVVAELDRALRKLKAAG